MEIGRNRESTPISLFMCSIACLCLVVLSCLPSRASVGRRDRGKRWRAIDIHTIKHSITDRRPETRDERPDRKNKKLIMSEHAMPLFMYAYIYIYIYVERERDESCKYIDIYIYI